jgi:hypothetical protein
MALVSLAHASDLQLVVTVPGSAPVRAVLASAVPGATYRVEVPRWRGAHERYELNATVEAPESGWDWRVAWRIVAIDRHGEARLVSAPEMQTREHEVALFTDAAQMPVATAGDGNCGQSRVRYHRDGSLSAGWACPPEPSAASTLLIGVLLAWSAVEEGEEGEEVLGTR